MNNEKIIKQINKTPRRNNYVSPNTRVGLSVIHGIGLFATRNLRKGVVVAVWGGHAMTLPELKNLPTDISSNYAIEIHPGFWLAEKNASELDAADFINHSCDPNCKIINKIVMITKSEIRKDEELTADFSYEGGGRVTCACRSRKCRGLF